MTKRTSAAVVFLLALVSLAAPAGATSSGISMGQYALFSFGSRLTLGQRPCFAAMPREYHQLGFWMEGRAAFVDTNKSQEFRAQLGLLLRGGIGGSLYEDPPPDGESRVPMEFELAVGMPLRVATWNTPMFGMLALRLEIELSGGGAHWWSDTLRFALEAGLVAAMAFDDDVRLEIDYTAVPIIFSGSPSGLNIRRSEHQLRLQMGFGRFGFGISGKLGVMQTGGRTAGACETVFDTTFSVTFDLRLGD